MLCYTSNHGNDLSPALRCRAPSPLGRGRPFAFQLATGPFAMLRAGSAKGLRINSASQVTGIGRNLGNRFLRLAKLGVGMTAAHVASQYPLNASLTIQHPPRHHK